MDKENARKHTALLVNHLVHNAPDEVYIDEDGLVLEGVYHGLAEMPVFTRLLLENGTYTVHHPLYSLRLDRSKKQWVRTME